MNVSAYEQQRWERIRNRAACPVCHATIGNPCVRDMGKGKTKVMVLGHRARRFVPYNSNDAIGDDA